jgi:tRNA uridine 5-carboxymethylaminomethyl modification enzyme
LAATPNELARRGVAVNQDGIRRRAWDLLAYPDIDLSRLRCVWPELADIAPAIAEQTEIEASYTGYIERQDADIRAFKRDESLNLPADIDYGAVPGLSNEVRAKLGESRPATLGAASRIPGMTPAAITILLGYLRRRENRLSA